jgi:hypothetical protein
MVSLADIAEKLRALRKDLVDLFDQQGWTDGRRALVERLDKALAQLSDSEKS